MMSKITYKVKREEGFVFTATAMVISVILGLTILFMTNTIRTESVRVAELHSSQDAYWQAVADVEMAANMIQLCFYLTVQIVFFAGDMTNHLDFV